MRGELKQFLSRSLSFAVLFGFVVWTVVQVRRVADGQAPAITLVTVPFLYGWLQGLIAFNRSRTGTSFRRRNLLFVL